MYSGKSKRHCLKYEVAVSSITGNIVWCAGPYPGAWHDLTIARHSGLLDGLLPQESILADKAYIGEACLVTPTRQPANGELPVEVDIKNDAISSARIGVEHFFGRMRNFAVIANELSGSDIIHDVYFTAVANIVCLNMYCAE
jgi:hypothetical protein